MRAAQSNGLLSAELTNSDMNLSGTASALEAIVDAVLAAFSGAQFIIAGDENNGTQSVSMTATLGAIKFGDLRFIIVISVINAVVVLLFIAEAIRNRAWIRSTMFDYRDLKSLVVGTSLRGRENGEVVERRLKSRGGQSWVGNSADTVMRKVGVSLENRDGTPAVSLGGGEEGEMLLESYTSRSESGEQLLADPPNQRVLARTLCCSCLVCQAVNRRSWAIFSMVHQPQCGSQRLERLVKWLKLPFRFLDCMATFLCGTHCRAPPPPPPPQHHRQQ
jgi:hypothetical protein